MLFIPPLPSLATRRISLSSRGGYRHTLVDASTNRLIRCESRLERDLYTILLARRDIAAIHEQPPAVRYTDDDGVQHSHVFDALLNSLDGSRIAVDVKPRHRVQPSGLVDIHRYIKAQIGVRFADRYLIRTEDHIHPVDVANAETILRARRVPDTGVDVTIRDLIQTLHGWCRLGDLVEASHAGAVGFNSLVRMIDEGVLTLRDHTRISYDCQIGAAGRHISGQRSA
ncbi:MAG: hypothetical protein H6R00_1165 [Proteobacteria bacterium]|nr:hypothetical protein [Pseudomonadota bacterium]